MIWDFWDYWCVTRPWWASIMDLFWLVMGHVFHMISYVDCDVDCDMDSYMPGGGGKLTTHIEANRWCNTFQICNLHLHFLRWSTFQLFLLESLLSLNILHLHHLTCSCRCGSKPSHTWFHVSGSSSCITCFAWTSCISSFARIINSCCSTTYSFALDAALIFLLAPGLVPGTG